MNKHLLVIFSPPKRRERAKVKEFVDYIQSNMRFLRDNGISVEAALLPWNRPNLTTPKFSRESLVILMTKNDTVEGLDRVFEIYKGNIARFKNTQRAFQARQAAPPLNDQDTGIGDETFDPEHARREAEKRTPSDVKAAAPTIPPLPPVQGSNIASPAPRRESPIDQRAGYKSRLRGLPTIGRQKRMSDDAYMDQMLAARQPSF